jgi:hypothetical protein
MGGEREWAAGRHRPSAGALGKVPSLERLSPPRDVCIAAPPDGPWLLLSAQADHTAVRPNIDTQAVVAYE